MSALILEFMRVQLAAGTPALAGRAN